MHLRPKLNQITFIEPLQLVDHQQEDGVLRESCPFSTYNWKKTEKSDKMKSLKESVEKSKKKKTVKKVLIAKSSTKIEIVYNRIG